MSTDFDQISFSIIQEQKRIQQNQQERNKKFNQCLQSYLNHLKQETQQLDSTEEQNDARNQKISSAFENVYERIMMSSQVALRKVKKTCFQKKQFWDTLIQCNVYILYEYRTDLQLKKEFYQLKADALDRYQDAIEAQNVKKIPYNLLLGKLKQKHNLKQWQANNKKLEQQVAKGTKTLKEWNVNGERKLGRDFYGQGTTTNNDSNYFINQFATKPETAGPWTKAPLKLSRYNSNDDTQILKNFQYKRP